MVRKRIHIDFAGPFNGLSYLVVVDAFSKWPETFIMSSTTSEKTISVLRTLFSRTGVPQILVSDNGTQFASREFKMFMEKNGIRHKFECALSSQYKRASRTFCTDVKTRFESS